MSISNALANAYSGLATSSRRAGIASHNIANATTDGYVRTEARMTARVTADRGAGVQIADVRRMQNEPLVEDRRRADANAGRDAALAQGARTIADGIGGPEDADSLFGRFERLETQLRALTEAPQSADNHENVVRAAKDLARGVQTAAEAVGSARLEAETAIEFAVDEINRALKIVEDANRDIQIATSNGAGDTTALEQQRDDAINLISEYIPVRREERPRGAIALTTDLGATLLDGNARTVEFTRSNFIAPEMNYRGGVGGLSGLTVSGIDITPGGGPQGLGSGKLAGLFEVRDGLGVEAQRQLDGLAADVIARFEASGVVSAATGAGLFTDAGAALDPADTVGLSSRIALNAAPDPEQGGLSWRVRDGFDAVAPGPAANAAVPEALYAAMTDIAVPDPGTGLVVERSASGAAADFATLFEARAQRAENAQSASAARRETLLSAEIEVSGVDVDRQLQELILIENAYAANAKVVQTVDRLINRLLEL